MKNKKERNKKMKEMIREIKIMNELMNGLIELGKKVIILKMIILVSIKMITG